MPDDFGTMTATWVDPGGVEWPLTDTNPTLGWFTPPGIAGWGATSYEYTTDPVPRGGESVRFIRAQPAHITWPLHVYSDTSHLEFVDRYRRIKRAFTMTAHRSAAGTLRVARPDGTAREIDCYYQDGFGGEAGENWYSANPVLTLYAPDGYWRDPQPLTLRREYTANNHSFLGPKFPRVSNSLVLGDSIIINPGDVAAWPTWTITGPVGAVTATNNTLGLTWTLAHPLPAGQQITITTWQPTVRGPNGENIVADLNWPTAYLWPLVDGQNAISIQITAAAAGTSVVLRFNPRFEGA